MRRREDLDKLLVEALGDVFRLARMGGEVTDEQMSRFFQKRLIARGLLVMAATDEEIEEARKVIG